MKCELQRVAEILTMTEQRKGYVGRHSPRSHVFMFLLSIALALGVHCANAGIGTAVDADRLLSEVRAAEGAAAWRAVASVHISGQLSTAGLTATYRANEDARRGRFDRHSRFSVFSRRDVWDGHTRWRQDNSGGVHRLDGAVAQRRNVTDAWMVRRGWLAAGAGGAYVGPVERRVAGGRSVAVVTAVPEGGQAVTLMFDVSTFDLVRAVRVMPTSVQVTTFDDYREVHGTRLPFVVAVDDSAEDVSTLNVASYVFAEAQALTFVPPRSPDDWTLDGPSVTVPIELRNGRLTITALINGEGPFRFAFDTGGQSTLSPALAAHLKLHAFGAGPSGGAGEGLLTEQYTRVNAVDIGGLRLLDQHFYVLPLDYATLERGVEPPLGGLLGLEVLERLAVRINYPARTMTFTPFASHRFDAAATTTSIRFDDDIPLVVGTLGGNAGTFALDTGNSGSMLIQRRWAERIGIADQLKRGVVTASFGVGGISRSWASRVDAFDIGGTRFDHLIARYSEDQRGAFASRTEAGSIGTETLANFVVDFDYSRGRMSWHYVPGYVAPPLNRSGLRARKASPEEFRVIVVAHDSPASRAGIRVGDRIVAVDGREAVTLSGADLADILSATPGTTVLFGLMRDGNPTTAALTLQEQLP